MRGALYVSVALLLAQGAHFQWRFHARPPERWYVFDARFPSKVLAPALEAARGRTVYLEDLPGRSGYIQALWHGTLRGVEPARFVRLSPARTGAGGLGRHQHGGGVRGLPPARALDQLHRLRRVADRA